MQSVNGSHQKGGCSRPTSGGQICLGLDEGGTSDLADCIIPSLGGFQTNWAAGLFTVNTSGQPFHIGFEFNGPVNLIRVELDLFNCPEWGIAAQSITVYEYNFGILNFDAVYARLQNLALGYTTANTTSCTSIVKVVIPLELPQIPTTSYVIYFTFDNTATNAWVHIAEVRFLEEEGTQCPTPSSTAGWFLMYSSMRKSLDYLIGLQYSGLWWFTVSQHSVSCVCIGASVHWALGST